MKRVSFSVAHALKEAGYPQDYTQGSMYFTKDGKCYEYDCELYPIYGDVYCVCPLVMEVWLWLWREKRIMIDIKGFKNSYVVESDIKSDDYNIFDMDYSDDPEYAIIAAIECLTKNNLIK